VKSTSLKGIETALFRHHLLSRVSPAERGMSGNHLRAAIL
jgi:hypothetical protein